MNLQPLADVTNNIIDKFSEAVGWQVMPRGSKKDTEIAVKKYIEDIHNDSSLSPIVRAAKICSARKDIKEYINIQDILHHAQEFGQVYEDNGNVLDEDWTTFFYDKARNISQEEVKILWEKILSEECHESGKIPKSLIHILSIMSKEDATLFELLCGFTPDRINDDGSLNRVSPIIDIDIVNELPLEYGLTYSKFQDLEALGLLHYNLVDIRDILNGDLSHVKIGYKYFENVITIENLKEEFPTGHVILTNDGMILSEMIGKRRIKGFEII